MTAAQDNTLEKDPVFGMAVEPDSPHQAEHAGNIYRFCSATRLDKFEAEPGRYPAPVEAEIERPTPRGG